MRMLQSVLRVVNITCCIGLFIGLLIGAGLFVHSRADSVRMEERRSHSRPALTYDHTALVKLNKVGLEERATPGLLASIPGELIRSASRWRRGKRSRLAAREGDPEWLNGRRRKRGRRGGIRRRLRQRKSRPALPAVILANLRSINNKIDDIRALARYSFEFREAALLCFTESWLHTDAPDSLYDIRGFSLIRADRNENSGKSRGGGICVYLNERWCRQYTIKHMIFNRDFELLGIGLRPFYLPREFGCILLFVVYVPPSGKIHCAAAAIAECVHNQQQQFPDAPAIVLGDFNNCNLEKTLPGFEQVVKCGTRKESILDKCYINLPNAYQSRSKPPISNSDHNVVHLIPTYTSKLKSRKPENKAVRQWTDDSREELGACFDCTDWQVLMGDTLEETCTVTTDYINFCVQSIIPTKTVKVYPNNKTYVTKDIKQLMNLRKLAFKNKDRRELQQTGKQLREKLRKAKEAHKKHLEEAFKAGNPRKTWDTMKNMTGMPGKNRRPFVTSDELTSATELNTFFTRFETSGSTERCREVLESVAVGSEDRVTITVGQVENVFRRLNSHKATGPDNISASILKTYSKELAPVWQPIF